MCLSTCLVYYTISVSKITFLCRIFFHCRVMQLVVQVNFDTKNALGVRRLTLLVRYMEGFVSMRSIRPDPTVVAFKTVRCSDNLLYHGLLYGSSLMLFIIFEYVSVLISRPDRSAFNILFMFYHVELSAACSE